MAMEFYADVLSTSHHRACAVQYGWKSDKKKSRGTELVITRGRLMPHNYFTSKVNILRDDNGSWLNRFSIVEVENQNNKSLLGTT